jgi:hypothetical protein
MAFNKLTPAQDERIALLTEELGEALQSVGKILRHGYESYDPTITNGVSNRTSLTRELGDIQAAINMMIDAGDIKSGLIDSFCDKKLVKVQKYLHHQPKPKSHDQPKRKYK